MDLMLVIRADLEFYNILALTRTLLLLLFLTTHIAFFELQHEIGALLLTMDQVPKKMAILGWPHYHRHDLPKFWACKKRLYNIEMDPNVVTIGRCRILAASLCEDECMLSYTAIPFLPS